MKHIAEISPPLHYHNGYWRHYSYVQTLKAHNLEPVYSIEGNWRMQSGYDAVRTLLKESPPFTALIVGTDKMALGALHAIREAGLSVPEDISIVGFDNSELAAFVAPPLTTIEFKFEKQDELTVKYLIDLIRDPELGIHHRILMPSLVVRESTRQI